jgi:hypothetical protein
MNVTKYKTLHVCFQNIARAAPVTCLQVSMVTVCTRRCSYARANTLYRALCHPVIPFLNSTSTKETEFMRGVS